MLARRSTTRRHSVKSDLGLLVCLSHNDFFLQRSLNNDGLGYEVFNVANADMSVAVASDEVRERFYAGVEQRRPMGPDETFYSIDKARHLLGYAPEHSWREVLAEPHD